MLFLSRFKKKNTDLQTIFVTYRPLLFAAINFLDTLYNTV